MQSEVIADLLNYIRYALDKIGSSPEFSETFLAAIFTVLCNYIDSNPKTQTALQR